MSVISCLPFYFCFISLLFHIRYSPCEFSNIYLSESRVLSSVLSLLCVHLDDLRSVLLTSKPMINKKENIMDKKVKSTVVEVEVEVEVEGSAEDDYQSQQLECAESSVKVELNNSNH